MTEKDINDMAHELWAVVNGSSSIPDANISDTVDRMIPVIRDYLSKKHVSELFCSECGKPMMLRYVCETSNCVENPNRVMPREDY